MPAAVLGAWLRRRSSPNFGFLLGWAIGPLVLLECFRTKLIHYYLPAYPACALLAAWLVVTLVREEVTLRRWPLGRLLGIGMALLAGAVGLILVVMYAFLYYRGLGAVAISSLAISALLTFLAVVLLSTYEKFALSLAGVAGLIVAIGITADSFVVFFERLRDEVRDGKSLRTAVERGWQRARRTHRTRGCRRRHPGAFCAERSAVLPAKGGD